MKFLKEQEITKSNKTTKIVFDQVTTSIQAKIIGLSATLNKVDLSLWLLKNIIKEIEINGQDYPPVDVANTSDLSDAATGEVIVGIQALVLEGILLSADAKKKSKQPEQPSKKGKTAEPVQGVHQGAGTA
jgi:GTPase SAR1 family protein